MKVRFLHPQSNTLKAGDYNLLALNEILEFIREDWTSEKKSHAKIGLRYYEGEHDIKDYKLFYFTADGELKEDKTRSNIKISHPFFTELVDQQVQYMLSGKNGFIKSDLPDLQTILDEDFNDNEDFMSELYETISGAIAKGFEYLYLYKDEDGRFCYQNADCLGVVEAPAKECSDGEDHIIYHYVDKIDKGKKIIRRVQVWDKTQTFFYIWEDEDKIYLDDSYPINPRPHVVYRKEGEDGIFYEDFGTIPFFRLDNCTKRFSGLKAIKNLIDDYDLMSCGLSNNLQDASEYLVVVKGFQGDNLEELIQNVKTKKHIGVDGEKGGGVEFKTVDIPYQARQTKLELDEKNIYRFGMGFNSAQLGDGNITNVVIKSRYALLDLKCNKLEIRLKQFLRKILKVILQSINDENGTDYQLKDVYFDFEREVMTNAQDNAQIEKTDAETQQIKINTLLSLAAQLGDELVIQNICEVLDLDYEEIKNELPDPEEDPLDAVNNIVPEDDPIDIGD